MFKIIKQWPNNDKVNPRPEKVGEVESSSAHQQKPSNPSRSREGNLQNVWRSLERNVNSSRVLRFVAVELEHNREKRERETRKA